ncbi:hypothetical protein, partial [Escherichia coli]|uniref:hypothetical protein n=2 Tax=Escherichia coli TaxID=562 RepID=UPI003904B036
MKIAAALGVCHFLVYKTTTPECWRRRLRMILAKKRPFPGKGHARMTLWVQRLHINYKIASAFTPERGCTTELHQKYIKITSLLRQIAGVQQNYIKSTSLLRHFYIIFTSDLTSELFVHPPPLPGPPARAENGFSGCAGNASRPRNKLGTVAKLAMRQPFVLFKGLTFQKLCLPGAFRPGDHHNK